MNKGNLKGTNFSQSSVGNQYEATGAVYDPIVRETNTKGALKMFAPGLSPTDTSSSRIADGIYVWATVNMLFPSTINSVEYGGGIWYAGGTSGALRGSTDNAVTWTTVTSNFGTSSIQSVAYGNGLWVAVGGGGTIRTSSSYATWTTQTSNFGTSDIRSVAYGNGIFVAAGDGGTLRTSTDAVTWATQTSNFGTSIIYSVAYGNGLWVAVGNNGTLRTSADNGVTWVTQTSNFPAGAINTVKYADNRWYAGGSFGTTITSTDGLTWTAISYIPPGSNSISAIGHANSQIIICAGFYMAASSDGVRWVNQNPSVTLSISTIAYGNGKWVAGSVRDGVTAEGSLIQKSLTAPSTSELAPPVWEVQ